LTDKLGEQHCMVYIVILVFWGGYSLAEEDGGIVIEG